MKKNILIIILLIVISLTGCGKVDKEKLMNKFINNTENIKGYYMEGILSINNNDDNYEYDVTVSYQEPDYFKVELLNKANNYEQVILRNEDGVYVVNPSLNKSFKFQSEWPYNNSQSYLLQSIATDLKNNNSYEFEQKDENYIYTVTVSYPNNKDIVKEKITLDKNSDLKMVEVLDKNDIPRITFKVLSLDKKAVFKDDYFKLDSLITRESSSSSSSTENSSSSSESSNLENSSSETNDSSSSSETTTTNKIDDALFPLYLPTNTSLSSRETITTNVGERVIMTFSGDNPFILVQENVSKEEDLAIIPSYGEPYLLIDTVGALTDTSYTWISNGVEYYIVSDVMSKLELLEVAKSINVVATMGEK